MTLVSEALPALICIPSIYLSVFLFVLIVYMSLGTKGLLCVWTSALLLIAGIASPFDRTPVSSVTAFRDMKDSHANTDENDNAFAGFDIFSMIDSYAMQQINAKAFVEEGLKGRGVNIGIIDGGFAFADTAARLHHHYVREREVRTYNLLQPEGNKPFYGESEESDFHGTIVWHLTGGYDSLNSSPMGLSTHADYFLASTDANQIESRQEEYNWVKALQWLKFNKVRLVNSSLTYSIGFDDPSENYRASQMDGHTAITSIAVATHAFDSIILVVAAGNIKDEEWIHIASPADAENAITVGATNRDGLKSAMSSYGSDYTSYVKPDIACYGFSGTSTAAPVITGLIGCMLEKDPSLSATRVKDILVRSSGLYPFPNNYVGYGVPDARRILAIMNGEKVVYDSKQVQAKDQYTLDVSVSYNSGIMIFHKSDIHTVSSQELNNASEAPLTIIRPSENIKRTTIAGEGFVREVIWQ